MSDLATRVELLWNPLVPGWALVLGGVAAVLVLALAWRSSAGVASRRRRSLLALRVVALLLLGLVVAGPERITTEGRPVRDPLVLLIDDSRSMRVEDSGGESRAATVGAWLSEHQAAIDALREDYDVRIFGVSGELTEWSGLAPGGDGSSAAAFSDPDLAASGGGGLFSGEPIAADGAASDLGGALFGLTDALDGARPAGAMLISDGADRAALGRAWRAGGDESVQQLVGDLSFPISTWTVGDPDGPADLAVRTVSAPPFGFVRRPLRLEVELAREGLPQGPVKVALHGEGELLAIRDARFEDGKAEVVFEVKPDEIGFHTYRVSVPIPDGDTIPSNNAMELTVKVVRDRTRVLQVTSRPSWDVKFLRRLLKTDPNIDLVSFFILRSTERRGALASREELSLIAFPYDDLFDKDLQGFDLVIFQNFWFGSWAHFSDAPFLESLARYVEDGGALLMVGGDLSFGEADYGQSPLARVLPTAVPSVEARTDGLQATLTEVGRRHPITRLDRDPAANEERWAALPPLQGHNPLGGLQEGAVSLLEAAPGESIAAVRSVGKGRSMAFATDTSWRWALAGTTGPGAGRDHADFWRSSIRWLVKDAEQRQVQVITDKENYRLGETIQVQVRVLGEDYAPRRDAAITGAVVAVSGREQSAPIEGATDEAGQYSFTVPADQEGTLVVGVDVQGVPDPFGHAEARVSVNDRLGELEDPRTRPDLMAAIAESTGGEVLGPDPDPSKLIRRPADSLLAVDRRVEPLWGHPLLLLLLALPLGSEWILRRRMGLR